jgi:hypothetical protein
MITAVPIENETQPGPPWNQDYPCRTCHDRHLCGTIDDEANIPQCWRYDLCLDDDPEDL